MDAVDGARRAPPATRRGSPTARDLEVDGVEAGRPRAAPFGEDRSGGARPARGCRGVPGPLDARRLSLVESRTRYRADRPGCDAARSPRGRAPLWPGWVARCPGHEDRHASLSVASGDDERALLTCHAGCATEVVLGALGLGMADLYPRTNGAAGPARPARGRSHETRYRARLADGSHAAERIEHVRLDRPNGTKRMWWERDGRKRSRLTYRPPGWMRETR